MTPPEFTHKTPSGILVYIAAKTTHGWYIMSNGSIIDDEILKSWEVKKAPENAPAV